LHRGVLLLVRSWVGAGGGLNTNGVAAVVAAHRSGLDGPSCPALSAYTASVTHGVGEGEAKMEPKN
jgi:hypothetical protein